MCPTLLNCCIRLSSNLLALKQDPATSQQLASIYIWSANSVALLACHQSYIYVSAG